MFSNVLNGMICVSNRYSRSIWEYLRTFELRNGDALLDDLSTDTVRIWAFVHMRVETSRINWDRGIQV